MRYLLINADDFGIGPATSQGILQLALQGRITSSVLMANSPYAPQGVDAWRKAGCPMELGWHPALTIDRPILPASEVPSLVDEHGRFFRLGQFLRRILVKRVNPFEIHAEFTAQYRRCTELLGHPPAIINTHHHIQVFPPVGGILKRVVADQQPAPYLRIIREPWPMLWQIPGGRVKRLVINYFGRRAARRQRAAGMFGNDWLMGITDPKCVDDSQFFTRWLSRIPGNVVELTCHPGVFDETLVGRDCTAGDGMLQRRVREMQLISHPEFEQAWRGAGFAMISPGQLRRMYAGDKNAA